MPIFFEVRPAIEPIRAAVRDVLAQHAPEAAERDATVTAVANRVVDQGGASIQPRFWSFVIAAALLAILAALALWADAKSMETSTDQLWTAFQTVLGVIVGFLGGEAAGVATTQRAG
jgi:hypothetical protein